MVGVEVEVEGALLFEQALLLIEDLLPSLLTCKKTLMSYLPFVESRTTVSDWNDVHRLREHATLMSEHSC